MYTPSAFRESDRDRLHDFMQQHSFALLVAGAEPGLDATHLPLLLKRDAGENGTLIGHMARANSFWKQARGSEVLVIYSGPHAYISPAWYEEENVVPTWNYVAVHAYGVLEPIEDESILIDILRDSVEEFDDSWNFDSTSEFTGTLLKSIVGFRIEISRLEGKWKLSQNQTVERREKVIRELKELGESERAIARLMRESLTET